MKDKRIALGWWISCHESPASSVAKVSKRFPTASAMNELFGLIRSLTTWTWQHQLVPSEIIGGAKSWSKHINAGIASRVVSLPVTPSNKKCTHHKFNCWPRIIYNPTETYHKSLRNQSDQYVSPSLSGQPCFRNAHKGPVAGHCAIWFPQRFPLGRCSCATFPSPCTTWRSRGPGKSPGKSDIPPGKHTKNYWKLWFIVDLPIKWWFSILMLVYQGVMNIMSMMKIMNIVNILIPYPYY